MTTVGARLSLLQSTRRRRRVGQTLLTLIVSGLLASIFTGWTAPEVLYTFTAPVSPSASPSTNRDGVAPGTRLVLGEDGYWYGTTRHGGANGAGSIFRVSTNGNLATLYSFSAATNNAGEVVYDLGPNDLVVGTNGSFYGTTQRGGSNFTGTVFEISPSGGFTNLHVFAAVPTTTNTTVLATSMDGSTPVGALVLAHDGNFYGTTQYGGSNNSGTLFRLTHAGGFASLYSFSSSAAGADNPLGSVPNPLTLGSDGALYATTQQGGLDDAGTFFRFSLTGGFTRIYSFNGAAPNNNPVTPNSTLVQGIDGNFYGTSAYGGSQGGGAIFAVTNTGGVNLLHSFPQLNAGAGATLSLGADGSFYGTVATNGFNRNGSLFRITAAGGFGTYAFGPLDTNADNAGGANPIGALAADSAGDLYGTCAAGGTHGSGVIFRLSGQEFSPPFFIASTNSPVAETNLLVGASYSLVEQASGSAPLTYQWIRDGTNVTDGGDIFGSSTGELVVTNVQARDVGSYVLVISNTWGSLTSSVTLLTVTRPTVQIASPVANASTTSPVFSGTASCAAFLTNTASANYPLTGLSFSLSNVLTGSNLTGFGQLSSATATVSNWSFAITPYPGTNVLSVQSVDASGNSSPVVSRSFFYTVQAPLTLVTTGTGGATFSHTNGEMLEIGQGYTITATPVASRFSNWVSDGIITYNPSLSFIMQSNLVLTADLIAQQAPTVSISSPLANARSGSHVFIGTAQGSTVAAGANPTNGRLARVSYWLTNSGPVLTGNALLTSGPGGVSNWSIVLAPAPGSNTLAVQTVDVSGDFSPVVARPFFYIVPTNLALLKAGTGNGSFAGSASISGDTPPSNGAQLNIGESYNVTAQPDSLSTFSHWVSNNVIVGTQPTLRFVMEPGLSLTGVFAAIPPVVQISSPAANQRTTAPVLAGTASGDFRITNISYSLVSLLTSSSSNGSAVLTGGAESISNWSIGIVPFPGSNTLTVKATDVLGDTSASLSQTFFHQVVTNLVLLKAGTGNGTFTASASINGDLAPANGAALYIGEGYTLTAKPDALSTFSGWAGSDGSSSAQPKLAFIMTPGLTLTATFAANPPVVAISSPAANHATASPLLEGTASGQFVITNVSYSLVSGLTGSFAEGSALLTAGGGVVSNWSIKVAPFPGSNTLTVQCQDGSGAVSAALTRTFFYEVPAALTMTNAGLGNGTFVLSTTGSGAAAVTNGQMLNVGQGYTIVAKTNGSSLFSNWVTSLGGGSATPVLPFVMRSNLVLTVTFIPNFYPAAAGVYNGLFYPSNAVAEETSGMLSQFTLTGTGTGSGSLLLAGKNYTVTTSFDASGHAAFSAGPAQVSLTLDQSVPQITGTVAGPGWTAELTADLAASNWPPAEYGLLFPPSTNVSAVAPPGDGYALVTNRAGMVTLSGALADGTRYNQSVPVSQAGEVPVYASLYQTTTATNAGLLLGWINLTNLPAGAPTNGLVWIKKASALSALYPKGFTNVLLVEGSPWSNPPTLSLTNGNLVISNASLALDFTNILINGNHLTEASLPTNSLYGVINAKTGQLSLSFDGTNGSAFGVVLQNTTNAGGYFLTATNAGAFLLKP